MLIFARLLIIMLLWQSLSVVRTFFFFNPKSTEKVQQLHTLTSMYAQENSNQWVYKNAMSHVRKECLRNNSLAFHWLFMTLTILRHFWVVAAKLLVELTAFYILCCAFIICGLWFVSCVLISAAEDYIKQISIYLSHNQW